VIFPIQTVAHNANPDDIEPLSFVLNATILGGGIALNTLRGSAAREVGLGQGDVTCAESQERRRPTAWRDSN
jgi:hypothetical protein